MSNANPLELGMLDLINAERAAAGLDPLQLITLLNAAAETHSQWMLEDDQFSHTGDEGTSPSDRMAEAGYPFEGNSMALENIGWQSLRGDEGAEDDVAQVHQSLMNSPGHRDNILNPNAEDIGIGIETGTFSGSGGDYEAVMVTQVFGSTDADISAWVDPGTGVPADDDMIPEDDMIAEEDTPDDTPVMETPNEPDTEEPTDPVDPVDPQPEDPAAEEETPNGEDDDVPEDTDDEPDVAMMDIPLPCGLTEFTVDLSNAFTFKQEGDQWIWETSEEQLVDTFMAAFEDWAANADAEGDDTGDEMDIADLMLDGAEDPMPMTCGAEDVEFDDLLSQSCI